jgi:hypothetical protein
MRLVEHPLEPVNIIPNSSRRADKTSLFLMVVYPIYGTGFALILILPINIAYTNHLTISAFCDRNKYARAKSQEPRAKSQEPRAKSQEHYVVALNFVKGVLLSDTPRLSPCCNGQEELPETARQFLCKISRPFFVQCFHVESNTGIKIKFAVPVSGIHFKTYAGIAVLAARYLLIFPVLPFHLQYRENFAYDCFMMRCPHRNSK